MASQRIENQNPADLVLRAGQLMFWKNRELCFEKNKDVFVSGGKISKIQASSGELKSLNAKKHIDASSRLVMPGLVNSHGHLPMSFFRGLADDLSFQDWLFKNILPLEARVVNPEFVRIGTKLSLLESIQWGVTTLYDMFYFEDDIADEVDRSGLRAILGQSDLDHPTPDNPKKDDSAYKIMDRLREKYSSHERIVPMISPHAPYSCSDETLRKAAAYSEKYQLPLGIHVSETKQEWEESMQKYGMSPVQRMVKLGLCHERSIFAHCVHLDNQDIETLVKTKTSVAYNPESNMKLGVGAARIVDMLKAGVTVGIGTDGPASNNDLNIFREMDVGAKLQKLASQDPSAITAKQLLYMGTLGGAKALKFKDVGNIEEGYWADLIVLDIHRPHLQPVHDLASSLVYAANGSEVETVLCHGKLLMENRKFLTLNPEAIYSEVAAFRKAHSF